MTSTQSNAIWELCRQGFPLIADEVAACWERGEHFRIDDEFQVGRALAQLIEQCNWEIETQTEEA